MALGKRKNEQQEFWIATTDLPKSPGHPFYRRLNRLLAEADFDRFVEALCEPYYAKGVGRPGIPPGVYFRMLLVGYFEGIGSQRGIAWRTSDSLSLRAFLGLAPDQAAPDHSSLTVIRQRLPYAVHEQVFTKVLQIAHRQKLLKGKTVAVDATTLEANAAMKSIVRRHGGEDWKAYLKRLAEEAGLENPTDEDLRRFDKKRPKQVSNRDWVSRTDPDSRIARMKDGRTHLAYKAEHAIDLASELIVSATIHPADRSDPESLKDSLVTAQATMVLASSDAAIREVVADKGYHKAATLAQCDTWRVRTYIPERRTKHRRRWTDKPAGWEAAFRGNRRRVKASRGRHLQRQRSERVERSFAHVCETGGARRTWIRGLVEVGKRYLMAAAAHNLSVILRAIFGIGTARSLQAPSAFVQSIYLAICRVVQRLAAFLTAAVVTTADPGQQDHRRFHLRLAA